MKKTLFAIVMASAVLVSCSTADKKANDAAADFKAKIENTTNPDSLKAYIDQANAYYEQLKAEGKTAEAEKYMQDITATVTAKGGEAATILNNLTLKDKAEAAVDSLASATGAAVDSVGAALGDAKDKAVDAATGAVNAAKDKASEVVSGAADKAADAANKVADAAKDKVNDLLGK